MCIMKINKPPSLNTTCLEPNNVKIRVFNVPFQMLQYKQGVCVCGIKMERGK